MITVACVWVKGNVPYSADYVTRLYSMAARQLGLDFEFACLTDRPTEAGVALARLEPVKRFERVKIIAIPSPEPLAGWWSKLELFNPAHEFGGRVLYLDLDVLIVGKLMPLIDYRVNGNASPFALVPPGGNFNPLNYRTVRRYNSSVMVFTPSERLARLYSDFDKVLALPSGSTRPPLWGDQDWIGEQILDADTMPAAWFPRLSDLFALPIVGSIDSGPLATARARGARVVLVKKPKPHVAAGKWPWFKEAWQ